MWRYNGIFFVSLNHIEGRGVFFRPVPRVDKADGFARAESDALGGVGGDAALGALGVIRTTG